MGLFGRVEALAAGVFVHEYGHDLDLPDLYDTSSSGANSVQFWALMSTGSHSGPIFQSMPSSPETLVEVGAGLGGPGRNGRLVDYGNLSKLP